MWPVSPNRPDVWTFWKRAWPLVFGRFTSLATTITRKRARPLIFWRFTSLWLPPPPTAPKTKHDHSFSGGSPFSGNHHHPQPPKMSTIARFQEVYLSLATTTTRKRARLLIFWKFTTLWQPPSCTTPPKNEREAMKTIRMGVFSCWATR